MTGPAAELLLQIDSLAFGGDGVARRPDGKVVFVPFTVPGDRVAVRIVEERRRHSRAEVTRVVESAPDRRSPACELFGRCGGCQWQHMTYEAQAAAKQRIFAERLPGVTAPIVEAEAEMGYRRRVRLHWRRGRRLTLGFMRRGSHRVLDVRRCPLLAPALQRGLTACRIALEHVDPGSGGTAVVVAGRHGTLHVSVRSGGGTSAGDARLADVFERDDVFTGGTVGDHPFGGEGVDCGGEARPLWASAACFVQANVAQDRRLRRLVRETLQGGEQVLELFAGVGNLTAVLQGSCRRVVAVESSPEATPWLRRNTAACGSCDVEVVQARASEEVDRQLARGGRFDLVLLDPPREGCDAGTLEALVNLGPDHVVYVSCDPMTLARDLALLCGLGLRVERARALDMMPQTYHIEAVVSLRR